MNSSLLEGITWFRGSSLRICRGGVELYVDPLGLDAAAIDTPPADVILVTHPHYENFSQDDLERLRGPDTIVVAPATMKKHLGDADHFVRPGDMLHLDGLEILAMPAYNTDKHFHLPENGWLGYVFSLDGVTYYHAGDTDLIEAMGSVRCDVAFLPVDGHYTMNAAEAAEAAVLCGADVVVPIRWGPGPSAEEAERLSSLGQVPVAVLERAV